MMQLKVFACLLAAAVMNQAHAASDMGTSSHSGAFYLLYPKFGYLKSKAHSSAIDLVEHAVSASQFAFDGDSIVLYRVAKDTNGDKKVLTINNATKPLLATGKPSSTISRWSLKGQKIIHKTTFQDESFCKEQAQYLEWTATDHASVLRAISLNVLCNNEHLKRVPVPN